MKRPVLLLPDVVARIAVVVDRPANRNLLLVRSSESVLGLEIPLGISCLFKRKALIRGRMKMMIKRSKGKETELLPWDAIFMVAPILCC